MTAAAAAVLAAAAALPWLVNAYVVGVATTVLVTGVLVAGVQWLSSVAGLLSLGQAAYLGVGAYTAAQVALYVTALGPVQLAAVAAATVVGALGAVDPGPRRHLPNDHLRGRGQLPNVRTSTRERAAMHDSARSARRVALHFGQILALTGTVALSTTATNAAARAAAQPVTAVSGGSTARPEPAAGNVGAYSEVHLVRHTTIGDVVHEADSWRWRHDLDASGTLHQRTGSTPNTSSNTKSSTRSEITVYPPGGLPLWSTDPPPADTIGFRHYLTGGLVLPGDAGIVLARIIDGNGVLCLNPAQRAAVHDLVVDLTTAGNGPGPTGVEVRTTTAGTLRYQLSFNRGTGTLNAAETSDTGGGTQPPLRQHIVWLSCRHTDTSGGALT